MLPEPLAPLLAAYAHANAARAGTALLEGLILAAMATLPPGHVAELERRIADAACLRSAPPVSAATPRRAWLLLCHRNGHQREAALDALSGPAPSPFHLALLAWRLADWVPQVRAAAARAAARIFPATGAITVARAAPALLLRWAEWPRTDPAGKAIADSLLGNRDVAATLYARFASAIDGPLPRELTLALGRTTRFDGIMLEQLARTAVHPAVRAVACRTLIAGEAAWPAGYRLDPAEQRLGRTRWLPHIARRALVPSPLAPLPEADAIMRLALADRSALVRRVGADALIRRRHHVPDLPHLAARLAADPSPALRARGTWLQRPAIP